MVDHQIALQVKKLFHWQTKLLVSRLTVHGKCAESDTTVSDAPARAENFAESDLVIHLESGTINKA